jgi:glycosyltransferase involved in cell wall biosynthesis
MGKVNLSGLNKCYGTNLDRREIDLIEIPHVWLFKNHFDALRGYRLARFCKKKASEYDLMISTYNVMDFGKRGMQFIADFSFDDALRRAFDPKDNKLNAVCYKKSPIRTLYLKLGQILSGASKDGWKKNLTIANSDWSRKVMIEVYGIETRTIYPPVVDEFPDIAWNRREDGFICMGRLVPEKRMDRVIEILHKVKKRGWNIHLHIFGKPDNSMFVSKLRKLCEQNRDWSFMEGTLFGQKKLEFIAQHKFGISGRENEPFGIALAEMVKAGCIVFAPNRGGQREIVNHPALLYEDVEEAVDKIERVLKSEVRQIELRNHLRRQSKEFSTERFKAEIREVVNQFLKNSTFIESPIGMI